MEKEKLGSEPAFPNECARWLSKEEELIISGMSKRFYAACAAMQGILASWQSSISFPDMAKKQPLEQLINTAYAFADELLKQERL